MPLPVIPEWTATRTGLHQAAQVIGAVRAAVAEPEPNWVHLGLHVIPQGLTTGELPTLGEMVLDFTTLTILFKPVGEEPVGFALARHSQTTLMDAVAQELANRGHTLKRGTLTGTDIFALDPLTALTYARALSTLAGVYAAFRDHLPGTKTPAIVWPHGFDLSFLWFATETTSEDAPHMAFGFSPFSAGLERPYLYSYPYPVPPGLTDHDLPPLAHWHTDSWTGAVIPYDALAQEAVPEHTIQAALQAVYDLAAPLLR